MAHWRVENDAFTVLDRHHHWLVSLALGAVGGGEDGHVLGGTAEGVVQLVLRVHPLGWHPLSDRVGAISNDDLEGMLRAVTAAAAGLCIPNDFAVVVVVDVWPVFLCAASQTPNPKKHFKNKQIGKCINRLLVPLQGHLHIGAEKEI